MDISSLKTGDVVTIHPRYYAGGLDTEAGAQPWKATFVAQTTDGLQIIIDEGALASDGTRKEAFSPANLRFISPDSLDPTTARQRS